MTGADESGSTRRLVKITLDEESIGRSGPDIEHERAVAIYDLIEDNSFAPVDHDGGPYMLHLSISENRLVFDIRREDGTPVMAHLLSLTPFRRIVKDYFMICDSYYKAIRTSTPSQIEAIFGDRKMQRVRSAVVIDRRECVVFQEIVDRDRTLVLDVRTGAADRAFVQRDLDEAPRRTALVRAGHLRFSRIATDRACASRPSAWPNAMAAGPSLLSAPASRRRIEVRFMKSSTPSPEENRAERAVGSTWFEPAT